MTIFHQESSYTIRLSRATPDDIPALMQVQYDAFAPNLFVQVSSTQTDNAEFEKELLRYLLMPNVACMKAEAISKDGACSQIVAWSFWAWSLGEHSTDCGTLPTISAGTFTNRSLPAGSLAAVFNDAEKLWAQQWFTNRDHMVLALLGVTPKFQGRGIGEKLLEWGTKEADRRGLVCHLTATPVAWRIYERFGWHVVEEQKIDLSEWASSGGLERRENDQLGKDLGFGVYVWRRMIRLPQH